MFTITELDVPNRSSYQMSRVIETIRNAQTLVLSVVIAFIVTSANAGEKNGRLDLYFIDVEGGAAMLVTTPDGKSMLFDSGYPDLGGRDKDRILRVAKDVAGLDHLDAAYVTHWHMDHYGNHAALAAEFPIKKFYDRGIPDALQEDKQFEERISNYRQATQNSSTALSVGDEIKLGDHVSFEVVTSGRNVATGGEPNPFADEHEPKKRDASDNAASLSVVMSFGDFRMLHCGDLTWNVEADLVTPNNPVGQVDLLMVTHHGLPMSNNPVLVKAVDPITAVMCNGPTKGGHPSVFDTLRSCKSLQAWFQLHQNVKVPLSEQTNPSRIANTGDSAGCEGRYLLVSVDADGKSYKIGVEGERTRLFATRSR